MIRGGTRSVAVFTATALVALLLAACGSSDSGSSDSSSTDASSTTETSAQDNGSGGGEGENGGGGQQEQGGSQGGSGESKSPSSTGFTAEEVETPLKVSGGGSEQFRVKGGDNSIQEYGEEGDESELQEAAEATHGFFVARAEGDWAGACAYLSAAMREQLERLAASSTKLADKGCASFLGAFTSHVPASVWREVTTVNAGSLRRDGEQAFLIYYGADDTAYAMPMTEEDGEFKVGALSGNALN